MESGLAGRQATSVSADLVAGALLHAPAEALPELRRQPGPGAELPPGLLRQSDEQTVAGLAAVRHAAAGRELGSFAEWGVVGAPRCPGRAAFVQAAERFTVEGAWAVTPHLLPHRTLHSLAGTVSLALESHGPNVGAGGPIDALLIASTLLDDGKLPGVWVVLTMLDPEPPVGRSGGLPSGTGLVALALALLPARDGSAPSRFMLMPAHQAGTDHGALNLFDLIALIQAPGTVDEPACSPRSFNGGAIAFVGSDTGERLRVVRIEAAVGVFCDNDTQ